MEKFSMTSSQAITMIQSITKEYAICIPVIKTMHTPSLTIYKDLWYHTMNTIVPGDLLHN